MLSASALDDLAGQATNFSAISKIFLNISRMAILAFVLDKLQTVGSVPSVEHQNLSGRLSLPIVISSAKDQ